MDQPQLHMFWPILNSTRVPEKEMPAGYDLRTFQPGDEAVFFELMAAAGWDGWDRPTLQPHLMKILPDGWYMVVDQSTKKIVSTAMALHNYHRRFPFWGNIGWVATTPDHRGRGLGRVVTIAVTERLIEAGYTQIGLHTEDFRLPAIKIYLTLGYIPNLYLPEMSARWQTICHRLDLPFSPKKWAAEASKIHGY